MYVFLLLLIQLVKKVGTKVSERKMLLEIIFRNLQLMSPYFWTTLYIPNHSNFGRNKSNSKLGRVLKQRIRDMKRIYFYFIFRIVSFCLSFNYSFTSFYFVVLQRERILIALPITTPKCKSYFLQHFSEHLYWKNISE